MELLSLLPAPVTKETQGAAPSQATQSLGADHSQAMQMGERVNGGRETPLTGEAGTSHIPTCQTWQENTTSLYVYMLKNHKTHSQGLYSQRLSHAPRVACRSQWKEKLRQSCQSRTEEPMSSTERSGRA